VSLLVDATVAKAINNLLEESKGVEQSKIISQIRLNKLGILVAATRSSMYYIDDKGLSKFAKENPTFSKYYMSDINFNKYFIVSKAGSAFRKAFPELPLVTLKGIVQTYRGVVNSGQGLLRNRVLFSYNTVVRKFIIGTQSFRVGTPNTDTMIKDKFPELFHKMADNEALIKASKPTRQSSKDKPVQTVTPYNPKYLYDQLLKTTLTLHTNELFHFIQGWFTGRVTTVDTLNKNYIIVHPATYSAGDTIGLVAHMDTVRTKASFPIKLRCMESAINGLTIDNANGILGGDDRAGIAILLMLGKLYPSLPLIFTNYEEIYPKGVTQLIKDISTTHFIMSKIKLFIEFDRKGTGHYATYWDTPPSLKKVLKDEFGLTEQKGSYTDVKDLSKAYSIPAINMAVGFHNAHKTTETLVIKEWEQAIFVATDILDRMELIPKFHSFTATRTVSTTTATSTSTEEWWKGIYIIPMLNKLREKLGAKYDKKYTAASTYLTKDEVQKIMRNPYVQSAISLAIMEHIDGGTT